MTNEDDKKERNYFLNVYTYIESRTQDIDTDHLLQTIHHYDITLERRREIMNLFWGKTPNELEYMRIAFKQLNESGNSTPVARSEATNYGNNGNDRRKCNEINMRNREAALKLIKSYTAERRRYTGSYNYDDCLGHSTKTDSEFDEVRRNNETAVESGPPRVLRDTPGSLFRKVTMQ